jgi:hypothetical protein
MTVYFIEKSTKVLIQLYVRMCVCVCMCVCMYVCVYVCCMYVCMYVLCICVCMYSEDAVSYILRMAIKVSLLQVKLYTCRDRLATDAKSDSTTQKRDGLKQNVSTICLNK